MKSKDLKGKKVVSIKEGAQLGQVDDVLVDPEALRVAALHVTGKGEEVLVPFDQVQSAGSDVVTVPSSVAAQRPRVQDEAEPLMSLGAVTKLKVVDEEGTFLGVVQGLEVDPQSGAILELQTQKATALGLGRESHTVAASEVTSVGEEMIVIQAPAPLSTDHDGVPTERATISVVPKGTMPNMASVPASRPATVPAVPSPPTATTTGRPAGGSER